MCEALDEHGKMIGKNICTDSLWRYPIPFARIFARIALYGIWCGMISEKVQFI
jgi:hypothetical protein